MLPKRRIWLRRTIAAILSSLGVLTAFIAGIWYSQRILHHPDSWRSLSFRVTVCPPPEGELHDIPDFIRANAAVEAYLAGVEGEPEHEGLRLHYIGTPSEGGYDIHWSSGNPSRGFPEKLRDDLDRIFRDALEAADEPS